MTKVKVSKEVAEDLKWYERNYKNWEETVIIDVIGSKLGLTSGVRAIALDKAFGVMSLVDAVTNGYIIKQTPSQELLNFYLQVKLPDGKEFNPDAPYFNGVKNGIEVALNKLNIKIDGINQ